MTSIINTETYTLTVIRVQFLLVPLSHPTPLLYSILTRNKGSSIKDIRRKYLLFYTYFSTPTLVRYCLHMANLSPDEDARIY